ncbi:MAG TPA: aspartate/glutamate racemase family protein [Nitrososphaerales archaeon]|nr:aspartate/glutamate racemase family protein [Nitrososphaerales archaeon]
MNKNHYKIMVVNPILTTVFDEFDQKFLQARAGPQFTVEIRSLSNGVETIEGDYDDVLCAPFVVDKVLEAERDGYDAAIIDCFLDPGLGASREASNIVVVGPGEASMLFSMTLGDSFSILSTSAKRYKSYVPNSRVRHLGLSDRFVSEWGAGFTVASIPQNPERTVAQLVHAAKQIQEQDEPDVLILGCTGLSRVVDLVAPKVGIPLIDPSIAALSMAQALLLSGFKQSRKTYPRPGKKERKVPGTGLK